MVKFVENELQTIKLEVNGMWSLVQQQLENAYHAISEADKELANSVTSREKRVNAFELKIDSDIEDFIALYNPVAIDLRFALAMMNICNNLERIGDYAEGIARFVVRTDLTDEDREFLDSIQLGEMFEAVIKMYAATFEALKARDIDAAKRIFDRDDELDEMNRKSLDALTEYAAKRPDSVRFCLEVSAIFRKLERAGDHINNLAEETIYYIDAEVVKHNRNKEPLS